MKKILVTAILLATTSFYAQDGKVGVGNTAPKATLDVSGTPASATVADGIIAPRLTGDQLAAKDAVYLADQTGTQVYVTAATTTPAGKTINVTAPGYYYFDGTVWQKVVTGASGSKWTNDATNTLVRLTNLSNGTTARPAGAEFVVIDNGNVGIGTTTPSAKLDVNGSIVSNINSNSAFSSLSAYNANGPAIAYSKSSGTGNAFVRAEATGTGLPIIDLVKGVNQVGIMYYASNALLLSPGIANEPLILMGNGGNVGIGTATPTEKLQVNGKIRFSNALMPNNLPGTAGQVLTSAGAGTAPVWATNTAVSSNIYIADGTLTGNRTVTQGANSLSFLGTGNVGIGTSTPSEKLDVNGNIVSNTNNNSVQGLIAAYNASGPTGVLSKSSGTGNALVRSEATGTGVPIIDLVKGVNQVGSMYYESNALLLSPGIANEPLILMGNGGKVGIGTATPAEKLDVNGSIVSSTDNNSVLGSIAAYNASGPTGVVSKSSGTGNALVRAEATGTGLPIIDLLKGVNQVGSMYYASNALLLSPGIANEPLILMGNGGNVGIGTSAPKVKLEVIGAIKVGNEAATSTLPAAGMIRFNVGTSKFEGYDGTNWVVFH